MDCRTNGLLLQGGNVANTKNELFASWCGHNSWGLLKLFWLEPLDSAIWQLYHNPYISDNTSISAALLDDSISDLEACHVFLAQLQAKRQSGDLLLSLQLGLETKHHPS